MKASDYYPAGTYNDPNAPWNQVDPEPIEVDVTVSTTLSKNITLKTLKYEAETWEDWDVGDEGETIHTGGTEYYTSDDDLYDEYREHEFTVLELLNILKEYVTADKEGTPHTEGKSTNIILKSLNGWVEDELEVVKD